MNKPVSALNLNSSGHINRHSSDLEALLKTDADGESERERKRTLSFLITN